MKRNRYLLLLLFIGLLLSTASRGQGLPGGLRLPGGRPGGGGGMPGGGGGGLGGGGSRGGVQLDDSTRNIYGPNTALHFFEDDILNNRDSVRYRVDTTLTNFHRWTWVDRSWERLVDLGNLGTATRNVFFQPRTEVGAELGFRAYDPYAIRADEVQYFNTRSPFTDMTFFMGGRGRNIVRFGFNQNINPRLNAGFQFQRFTSNKQYGVFSALNSEANLAQNWTFLAHTNYTSKDKKYILLGHFRHLNHQVKEQGGLLTDSTGAIADIYEYEGPARLEDNTRSWERRNVFHLYHQYRLANGFQLFQQAEYRRVINRYDDTDPQRGATNGVYPSPIFDQDTTRQEVDYRILENKMGIKGVFSGFNYRAYLRQRIYTMKGSYNLTDSTSASYRLGPRFENILGLWVSYYLKDSTQHLTAEAQHLLGRDFLLRGELSTRWIRAGYQTAFWTPDLIMQRYVSNHMLWRNNFNLTGANTLYGSIPLRLGRLTLEPEMQYHLVTNYVYYDSTARPQQLGGSFSLLRMGTAMRWTANRWNASALAFYTVNSNPDVIRIPPLFFSGQLTYDFVYAKVLFIQLGTAVHYKSSYLADAYMPLTQQFYLQNNFMVDRYAVVDVFANMRINRVRLLLKMSHLNEGLGVPGYFTTPGYLGLRRTFSFGISWPLFD
ncbi:putative porin [Telluribacter sp. SYSU D00476]|uniref:putative porin n=1 Tax=Telluribacter sp. SYSU D00476 TaxID=2811430 RepID=UPI001FF598F3|nr:putative porin [Telluribacter sp. SYSU D00476]